jgi:hypothetical protein
MSSSAAAGRAQAGIIESTAAHWNGHDMTWPLPEHRSVLLRMAV